MVYLFLYAFIGSICTFIPFLFPEFKDISNVVYFVVAIPFVFQVIYVEIKDMKEFEDKLFKRE